MPSNNHFIVAAAGGGKTTRVVATATENNERVALITYTLHNVDEIKKRVYEKVGAIPPHVEVWSWYSFLLHEMVRPYQRALYKPRVNQLHFIAGRSALGAKRADIRRFFFSDLNAIYSDKVACFACDCIDKSDGAPLRRLAERFDRIYVDEVQDLAGYDLELIEQLLRSDVAVTLVGDHRQATYRTNNSAKNSAYTGSHIVEKFREWEKAGLGTLTFEQETHRSNQTIATFADGLFPDDPATISKNDVVTGHDGVFLVPAAHIDAYIVKFGPQVLRLDVRTNCGAYPALNFGQAKGRTYDRVLIFPHGKAKDWIKTGDGKHIKPSAAKFYVGVTRARYSVAIVFDGPAKLEGASLYQPEIGEESA